MKKPRRKALANNKRDPHLILLALNLLIESQKTNSVPKELVQWLESEFLKLEEEQSETAKRAA